MTRAVAYRQCDVCCGANLCSADGPLPEPIVCHWCAGRGFLVAFEPTDEECAVRAEVVHQLAVGLSVKAQAKERHHGQ